MEKVILIRHGQSLANVDSKVYSQPDSFNKLSLKGIKQCRNLQSKIGQITNREFGQSEFSVISSGLTRAKLSAQIIFPNMNIPEDSSFNEVREDRTGYVIESAEKLRKRFSGGVQKYSGNLVIISHCYAIMFLMGIDYIKNADYVIVNKQKLLDMNAHEKKLELLKNRQKV